MHTLADWLYSTCLFGMSIIINGDSYSRNSSTRETVAKFRQLYRLFLSLRSCKEELFPLKFRILSEKLSRIIRNLTVIVPEGLQQIFLILCPYLLQSIDNKGSLQSFLSYFLKLLSSLLSGSRQENLIFHPKKRPIFMWKHKSKWIPMFKILKIEKKQTKIK